jgi:MFS transporter, ACS family, pantothenate transporter
VRPSYYIPTLELIWSIVTFCFAAVKDVKHVFALRFIVGFLEGPFAVGVITVMGGYYTKKGKFFLLTRLRPDIPKRTLVTSDN